MGQKKPKFEIVCRCNNIDRKTIEDAIVGGCDTMNKIFDATTAGVGPCGGSCRRKLQPMLEHYLEKGTFPEKLVADLTGKVPPADKKKTSSTTTAPDASPKASPVAESDTSIVPPKNPQKKSS